MGTAFRPQRHAADWGFDENGHRLDRIGRPVEAADMTAAVKKSTTGTKFSAEARKQCNKHSAASRMELTAAAMRLIYHSQAGTEKVVAPRR